MQETISTMQTMPSVIGHTRAADPLTGAAMPEHGGPEHGGIAIRSLQRGAMLSVDPVTARPAPRPARPGGSVGSTPGIDKVICFTQGTKILTQWGERPIEALHPGCMVVTRDHGLQPVRWMGQRAVQGCGDLAPVVITSAATGGEAPLMVSPWHRMLFSGYRAQLLFGESEVLVAARDLVNGRDVRTHPQDAVTYIHLMFDRHEVIYADGIASESFHAGDTALSGISAKAREELFTVFPELRSAPGRHRDTARRCLAEREAALLRQADDIRDETEDVPRHVSGATQ